MMEVPLSLFDGAIVAIASGGCAFVASYSATRVTLKFLQRDINRAQSTADDAHNRIDTLVGIRGRRASDAGFSMDGAD